MAAPVNTFIEITTSEHSHGGTGWEFGTCLWSPSRNRSGADRYANMREPTSGDHVLHIYHDRWPDGRSESRLCGRSVVQSPYREVEQEPPSPGPWAGMSPYYRIDLTDYEPFSAALPLSTIRGGYSEEIRQELKDAKPKYYPFNTHGNSLRTVQGIYLARATAGLIRILHRALQLQEVVPEAADAGIDPHDEYIEARRLTSERYFFARHPTLIKRAKERAGGICEVCGFNFSTKYGDLGAGYCEVHHLIPLSERSELEWTQNLRTRIEDVAVLCANCHRMVHRQRPALSLDALRDWLRKAS